MHHHKWLRVLLWSWTAVLLIIPGLTSPRPVDGGVLEELDQAIPQVVEEVMPAVVSIEYNIYFRADLRSKVKSKGAGFILNPEGFIITNAHILRVSGFMDKQRWSQRPPLDPKMNEIIWVGLADGRLLQGEFIFADSIQDLAIIKIKGDKFPVVKLGDSDQVKQGQVAIALGNPLGYESSVTQGIISATQRRMKNQPGDFIQTSAPIFPGNSGGPLVDIHGRVIGINTQTKVAAEPVLDASGKPMVDKDDKPMLVPIRTENMSFAIPIRRALDIVYPYLK